MKKLTKLHKGVTDRQIGDAYTFVGIERNTKLVLAWHLGDRDTPHTEAFTEKLSQATKGHFQLTTDGSGHILMPCPIRLALVLTMHS